MLKSTAAETRWSDLVDFIRATVTATPRCAPAGRDLQARLAEHEHEGGPNPWVSLAVRSSVACDHIDTVCLECLASWSLSRELRIAAVVTSVDVEGHRAAADEWYAFDGDPERQAPAYWVARHGRVVTSQVADDPVSTVVLRDEGLASGEFATSCCDETAGAPGEIRAGDTIELYWGPLAGALVRITTSTENADGFEVSSVDDHDRPESITVAWGQYRINRRPAAVAA